MVVMMFATAALGATGALLLNPGKSGSREEKHSAAHQDPQSAESEARTELADHSGSADHSGNHDGEHHTPEAHEHAAPPERDQLTADETHSVSDHAGAPDRSHPLGSTRSSENHAEFDPFSESALGLTDPEDAPAVPDHAESSGHEFVAQNAVPALTSERAHAEGTHVAPSHDSDETTDPASGIFADEHQNTDPEADRHSEHPNTDSRNSVRQSVADALSKGDAEAGSATVGQLTKITRQDRITQQAVNYLSHADEDLASGNYVQAMRAYQALRQKSEGPPAASLLFRLALCAEAAGRHAAAIEAYRRISGTQTDPAWAGVARYGEARCLSAMNRHEGLQSELLRRVLLDETELLPVVRNEILHLIGRDLWHEQSTVDTRDLLDDRTMAVPEWTPDPIRLLEELPLLIHQTPLKAGKIAFQVLNYETQTPEGIRIRLNCGVTRMEILLTKLIEGCRISCDISEEALQILGGRTQQIHVSDQSLALLLDAMTITCGLTWRLQDTTVQILHPGEISEEEVRRFRLSAAERILRQAVMEGPNSPQIGHSRLALSSLLFSGGKASDAVQFLQVHMESAPRSVVAAETAFNLGKCLMILNDRDESRQAFLRSIDSSGGLTDVRIAAYIFYSRMLLEDNQTRHAIPAMMRGLAISKGSELEPFAALHLASLYLMQDNPQGANTVLMEHRDVLNESTAKAAGAFLSALSRFRAAVLADRREREGAAVVSALTEFRPENYCGGHWAVLTAEACQELGLSQQATEAWVLALKTLPPTDLRNKTVLKLASRYQADDQLEEARLLLSTLSSSEADQVSAQARLRSAELALEQNRPDETIQTCRHLIQESGESQVERAALRLMGKAYERQKNHQAAIYCFAGMLPDEMPRGNGSDHSDELPHRPQGSDPRPKSPAGNMNHEATQMPTHPAGSQDHSGGGHTR